MTTGIKIGTMIDKQSLEPLTASIIQILEAKADQKSIRHALNVLGAQLETRNISIGTITVSMGSDGNVMKVEDVVEAEMGIGGYEPNRRSAGIKPIQTGEDA